MTDRNDFFFPTFGKKIAFLFWKNGRKKDFGIKLLNEFSVRKYWEKKGKSEEEQECRMKKERRNSEEIRKEIGEGMETDLDLFNHRENEMQERKVEPDTNSHHHFFPLSTLFLSFFLSSLSLYFILPSFIPSFMNDDP